MTSLAARPTGNRLLDGLPLRQRSQLVGQCETVQLKFGDCLASKSAHIQNVYFPLTGFASLVITIAGQQPLEFNMIGSEGMVGAELVLGIRVAPYTCVVQGSGTALRLDAVAFGKQLEISPALREVCKRYFHVLVEQMAQSIACNSFHEVPQRLARWLLAAHDCVKGEDLNFTHAFLAAMLGVRRSAVTIAAGSLQQQQLIRYSRGQICVLSRKGLERVSCECYAAGLGAYEAMLISGD